MTTARRIDVVWAVLCGLTVAVWLVAAVLGGDEPRVDGAETAIVLALAGVLVWVWLRERRADREDELSDRDGSRQE